MRLHALEQGRLGFSHFRKAESQSAHKQEQAEKR
jgi:hypothetical protein